MRLSYLAGIGSFLAMIAVGTAAPSKKAQKPTKEEMEHNTQVQIFLDQANFGPGKIDGHQGEFTKKALRLYLQSQGKEVTPPKDPKAPMDTSSLDLSSVAPVFTAYTVTADDAANVGELPSGPAAQAKVKRLPYASLAEAVAEKFHCDLDFLKKLNAGKIDKLKAGDEITVPNVKPFELSAVKSLQAGSEIASIQTANELGEDAASSSASSPNETTPPEEKKKSGEKKAEEKPVDTATLPTVHVSVKEEMLTVLAGDKLVAAFPVTVGSQQTASPIGHWKVQGVAKMPNFRYDPKMLSKGERSSNFHMLPPGPNNPVGVMWIALNKKGIGMHGTNDPDSIGRSASHGCIRLANWDVVKLAEMVKAGVQVTVE